MFMSCWPILYFQHSRVYKYDYQLFSSFFYTILLILCKKKDRFVRTIGASVRQSSNYNSFQASGAIDNDITTFSHTSPGIAIDPSWWEMELGVHNLNFSLLLLLFILSETKALQNMSLPCGL